MRSISLQQIRETCSRYVREARLASGHPATNYRWAEVPTSIDSDSMTVKRGRIARLKPLLREIPLVGSILVTFYRIVKLPGRVALIVRQLHNVYELQIGLTKLHDRVDALSWQLSAVQDRQESALRVMEGATKEQTLTHSAVTDTSQILVALHEKSDRYQQEVRASFRAIKPIIHAGDNLIISRVDDLIMAFPAEEWRLPAFQILEGQLEPGLFALMKSTIREGMVVVDIGANVGIYTLLALKAIGRQGKVISYEPTPRTFDILRNNVQVNGFLESGRIDLRQKAVSDGSRTRLPFFLLKNSLTHNSLYGDDQSASGRVEVIEVDTVSLDQDLADLPRVDVVKIDAEGAEPMILRGMREIIRRNPGITIFIEFAPMHLMRAKIDMLDFLADIRAQGFQIHEVVEPTGELRATTDEALSNCFSVNLMLREAV